MDPDMDMFLNHAGMTADNLERTKFSGLIFVHHFSFSINLVKSPSGYVIPLQDDDSLAKHKAFISTLNEEHHQHPSHYLNALVNYLKQEYPPHESVPTKIYRRVLEEYQEFINFYIYLEDSKLPPDLSSVTVTSADNKLRKHTVIIKVNYDLNKGPLFRLDSYDLPIEVDAADDSLINLYQSIIGTIESFEHFFDIMDLVDGNCWVVDPHEPKRAHCHRRIIIAEQLSALITFSPQHPTALPNIKLLGPARKMRAMMELLQGNYSSWDDTEDVLEGLLKLFGQDKFPKRVSNPEQLEHFGIGDCCICLSMRSETDKLTEIFCPNDKCKQPFHYECLHEWLYQTFQNSENKVRGNCPYCKATMSCDVLK